MPRYDLVVVGSGSAGLIAAELAAQLELRVAVVEESRIGGDCLWTGCVPSKALLAAGRAAHAMRTAGTYGLRAVEPEVDLPAVWSRIRRVQEEIAAAEDSPDRLAELGVELVRGHGRLAGPHAVEV
ncbi:MAG: FAD-dependent oxidoreductase, partial [Thermoleophilia bacterium]|nr:FAD-dependent oxidoreductase [Thermoleophilia bacterium]